MDQSEETEVPELVFIVERLNRSTGNSRRLKQTIETRRQGKYRKKKESKLGLHAQALSDIPISYQAANHHPYHQLSGP